MKRCVQQVPSHSNMCAPHETNCIRHACNPRTFIVSQVLLVEGNGLSLLEHLEDCDVVIDVRDLVYSKIVHTEMWTRVEEVLPKGFMFTSPSELVCLISGMINDYSITSQSDSFELNKNWTGLDRDTSNVFYLNRPGEFKCRIDVHYVIGGWGMFVNNFGDPESPLVTGTRVFSAVPYKIDYGLEQAGSLAKLHRKKVAAKNK